MTKRIFCVLFACLLLCVSVAARLSPAMEVIAKRMEKKCCVTSGTVLSFDKEDFSDIIYDGISQVKVTSLPSLSEGVLTLSGVAVKTGQEINFLQLDRLCYSPSQDFSGSSNITFEAGDVVMNMCVNVVSDVNYAPETADMTLETQKNIAVFKNALAADPDGDLFTVEIVDYPKHGSIRMTGEGQFVYRPLSGYTGKDSFSYRACDEYGNVSDISMVQVKVSRPVSDIYFDDMENHWAHNSAIKMAATGLMPGELLDGKRLFNPDKDMTRGDFLALSLIMAGHERNVSMVSKTVFADDSLIPVNIKSYVQYAYDKGIISGYDNGDGSINFESTGSVTRAEAAVITGKILSLSDDNKAVPSYKDASDIPAWASDSVAVLSTLGIINGDAKGVFCAEKCLSRAEGAEMICNVASYIEDKENEAKEKEKKPKSIFNLFGLLG